MSYASLVSKGELVSRSLQLPTLTFFSAKAADTSCGWGVFSFPCCLRSLGKNPCHLVTEESMCTAPPSVPTAPRALAQPRLQRYHWRSCSAPPAAKCPSPGHYRTRTSPPCVPSVAALQDFSAPRLSFLFLSLHPLSCPAAALVAQIHLPPEEERKAF